MQFPREEYWNGLPFPSSGDLPDPGTEPSSPALAGGVSATEPPAKPVTTLALLNSLKSKHGSTRNTKIQRKSVSS